MPSTSLSASPTLPDGLLAGDRVGVLTSGGDAPGMNAALRGIARVGRDVGLELFGIEDGYEGLLAGRLSPLNIGLVDEAARRGGTLLGTARSKAFVSAEGQATARNVIVNAGLSALIVIGGNGSLAGAHALCGAPGARGILRIAGIPASIDNDVGATSMSIGVDTAMNTIVEACDRILDTATAHRRTFMIEVMGRDCGYLAMTAGIASGADTVLVPESGKSREELAAQVARVIEGAVKNNRRRVLVIKSEGVNVRTEDLKADVDALLRERLPEVDSRVTVLGHIVRGGSPSAFDRLLGARLANVAVRALMDGESDFMAGWSGPGIKSPPSAHDPYVVVTPLAEVLAETARLHSGESMLGAWRKRVYREVETVLE
jgi:6-phosphofructokinase 1